MKKHGILKRLIVLAAALILTLALAVPAMAAGTVTIVPNAHTASGTANDGRFVAYQIFSGTLNTSYKSTEVTTTPSGIVNPQENELASIKWATAGIDVVSFVKELQKAEPYKTELAAFVSNEQIKSDACAKAVADILQDNATTSQMVKDFADVAAKCRETGKGTYFNWDAEKGAWTAQIANDGYYVIVDTNDSAEASTPGGKADSEHILVVLGDADQTIYVKSAAATVTKWIVTETGEKVRGKSYGFGDEIVFELEATLPENFDQYSGYMILFRDVMSQGLTYTANEPTGYLRVYATDGTTTYLVDRAQSDGGDDGYAVSGAPNATDTWRLTFNDLKKIKGKLVSGVGETSSAEESEAITVTSATRIIVRYTARLNADYAKLGNGAESPYGNPNSATLIFSNDPEMGSNGQTGQTGTTVASRVTVYTYGMDITKVDATKTESPELAGAGFALTKESDSTKSYAVFTKDADSNTYRLAGWITAEELQAKSIPADEDWSAAVAGSTLGTPFASDKNYYLSFISGADGKVSVKGLDNGTYTLSEVVTPNGYDTMEDVTVTVEETVDPDAGTLTGLEGSIGKGDAVITGEEASNGKTKDGLQTTGIVPITMRNVPAGVLPGTGGMGTTLFYIGGGALLVIAALFLVLSGRKKSEDSKR